MPTTHSKLVLSVLLLGLTVGGAGSLLAQAQAVRDDKALDPPTRDRVAAFARHVWHITDAILESHIEPPTRESMLRAGFKALLSAAKAPEPAELAQRVKALASQDQLTALLGEVWPRAGAADKLETALLDGMLGSVSGRPTLMPAPDTKVAEQISGNRYIGIGVQIGMSDKAKRPYIVTPIRGGPAHKAGLRAGDLIIEVDGKDTHGIGVQKAVEWLRGEEGTALTVVVRQPEGKPRTIKLIRTVVPFEDVFGFRRNGDGWTFHVEADSKKSPVGYLAVRSLRASTLHELRKFEPQLTAAGMRALVLDFRSSSGGILRHAALVADGLLDGGVLFRTRGRQGPGATYRADPDCLFRGWPLAVLVDGSIDRAVSAVAAALQDNGRAVLVGEPTRADGYGSSLIRLPDGKTHLVVRTFRMERAEKTRGWPVRPDHEVRLSEEQRKAVFSWFRAKELAEFPPGMSDSPPDDPQLRRAVEVLEAALKGKAAKG
ncbi:MAG: S41 family peptidase [Gemmataceae bacterium]|nr:S41 family peptidase [Gemmataceae bacterium]